MTLAYPSSNTCAALEIATAYPGEARKSEEKASSDDFGISLLFADFRK
jgi:hypothetical protein